MGSIPMKFSITGQEKRWPFYTGDCMGRFECYGITTYHELSSNAVIDKCMLRMREWVAKQHSNS
jgi:hypothetical protein